MKQISGMPNRLLHCKRSKFARRTRVSRPDHQIPLVAADKPAALGRLLLFGVVAGTLVVTGIVNETSAYSVPNQRSSAIQDLYYFGVMGEVAKPGVYQSQSPTPRLIELIRCAGGLSSEATGTIRVIRNARLALVTSCFASNSSTLMPGDLLIVDARLAGRTADRRSFRKDRNSRRHAESSVTAPQPTIQLGFVNLVARRPIVVKVSGQRATLGQVLADLGQSGKILSTIRLIENQRLRHGQGASVDPNHHLTSETVLVFDPNVIDYDRVPAFPRPYPVGTPDLNTDHGRTAPLRDYPTGLGAQASRPHNMEAVPWSENPTSSTDRHVPTLSPGHAPTPATIQPPSMLSVAPAEPIRPPQTTQTPEQDATNSDDQMSEPSGVLTEQSAVANQPSANAAGPRRNGEDLPDDEPPLPSSEHLLKFSSAILVVAVIGATALLLAVSMLWSMARVPTAPTNRLERMTHQLLLDDLIRDEVPLIEEPVPLPSCVQLHGRPHDARTVRVDATHAVPRPVMDPHTLAAENQPKQPIASVPAAPPRSSSASLATSVQTACQSSKVDSAWRRVESSHTERQCVTSTRSPVSSSIIDQALFSVQGDGHA